MALLETDPLDIAADVNCDVIIDEDKGLRFISGLDGVAQLCFIAIRLFLEEWFLDLTAGFPWLQEILGEKFNEPLIRQRVTEKLLAVDGVLAIPSLVVEFDGPTRAVTITCVARTVFGDTAPITVTKKAGL